MASELHANVKADFGAVGDGITDDSGAITAALASNARAIYFPDGTYSLKNIVVPTGKKLWGCGKVQGVNGQTIFTVSGDDVAIEGLSFAGNGALYGIILNGSRDVLRDCRFTGSCTLWILAQASTLTTVKGNSIDGSDAVNTSTAITFGGVNGFICTDNVLYDTEGFGIQSVCQASPVPITDGTHRSYSGVISNNRVLQPLYSASEIASAGQTEFLFTLSKKVARYGIQVNGQPIDNDVTIDASTNPNFTVTFASGQTAGANVSLIGYRALECIQVNSWAYDISIVGNVVDGTGDSGIVVGSDYHNAVLDPGNSTTSDYPGRVTITSNTIKNAAFAGIAINNVVQAMTIVGNNIADCSQLTTDPSFSAGIHTGFPSTSIIGNCITNTLSPPTMMYGLSLLAGTADDGAADKALKISGNSFAGPFVSKITLHNGGLPINQGVIISDGLITSYPESLNLDSAWANRPANTNYINYGNMNAGWIRDTTNILGGVASLQTVPDAYTDVQFASSAILQNCLLKLDFWAIAQNGSSYVQVFLDFNGNTILAAQVVIAATSWKQYTLVVAMEQFVQSGPYSTFLRIGANSGAANMQHFNISMIRIPN